MIVGQQFEFGAFRAEYIRFRKIIHLTLALGYIPEEIVAQNSDETEANDGPNERAIWYAQNWDTVVRLLEEQNYIQYSSIRTRSKYRNLINILYFLY